MEKIKQSLHKMQRAYSPTVKLHHLLGATSAIYKLVSVRINFVIMCPCNVLVHSFGKQSGKHNNTLLDIKHLMDCPIVIFFMMFFFMLPQLYTLK